MQHLIKLKIEISLDDKEVQLKIIEYINKQRNQIDIYDDDADDSGNWGKFNPLLASHCALPHSAKANARTREEP